MSKLAISKFILAYILNYVPIFIKTFHNNIIINERFFLAFCFFTHRFSAYVCKNDWYVYRCCLWAQMNIVKHLYSLPVPLIKISPFPIWLAPQRFWLKNTGELFNFKYRNKVAIVTFYTSLWLIINFNIFSFFSLKQRETMRSFASPCWGLFMVISI